jgi:excisionase family DNA binding protein
MSSNPSAPFGSLLTAQDVAGLLGVPASWVYAATREGRIPTVRLGRYYRYRRDTVLEWVATHEGVLA